MILEEIFLKFFIFVKKVNAGNFRKTGIAVICSQEGEAGEQYLYMRLSDGIFSHSFHSLGYSLEGYFGTCTKL